MSPRPAFRSLPAEAGTRILRWWREAGVQVRSTVAAAAVQALVVAAAGAVLLLTLLHNLQTSIDTTNLATAQSIAALAAEAAGNSSELQEAVDAAARRRATVQVIGSDGEVLAASSDLRGSGPIVDERPAVGDVEQRQFGLPFDDDPYRVTVLGGEGSTVVVAQSLGTGEDTLHAAVIGLAVAGPLLLLTVGTATYLFIGRSLRPVAEIRTTVERISHRDLSERVPIPPGHDEVARLARTMNSMLAGLDRADGVQRQFVSDASHELRSPIATLRAAAEIVLTVPDRADAGELARLVRGESERLDGLVSDLLLLARIDERGRSGTARPGVSGFVDLDDLVTAEARRVRTSTTLAVDVHREPAQVLGDEQELSRVLRNLTDNAARHAGTTVRIDLRRNGRTAVLSVTNDGPEIPPADRERVFDRFVRLEESRARDLGGSGLGLAIVRDVVTAHGGTVRVADPADGTRGTRFVVELPLSD